MARSVLLVAVVLVLAACGSKKGGEPSRAADAGTPRAVVATADAAPPRPSAPSPAQPQALSPAQRKAYKDALAKGRALTKAGDHAGAVEAFGAALAVIVNDPRALGERGYARLLAQDWAAARTDLEDAVAGTTDPKLLGALWYNLGLVAAGEGDLDASKRAFARSNAIRPSKAAAARIAAGPVCLAEIVRDPARLPATVFGLEGGAPATPGEVVTYPSWAAAFTGLTDPDDAPADAPTTDAAARAALCGSAGCIGPGPWVVAAGVAHPSYSVVVPRGGALVVFRDLGEGDRELDWSMCGDATETLRPELVDGRLHVHLVEQFQLPYSFCMDDEEGDECAYQGHDCSQTVRLGDYVFDVERRQLLLYLGRGLIGGVGRTDDVAPQPKIPATAADERPEVKATFEAAGVRLLGGGCDQLVPYVSR